MGTGLFFVRLWYIFWVAEYGMGLVLSGVLFCLLGLWVLKDVEAGSGSCGLAS
jgi:hypothetical protein